MEVIEVDKDDFKDDYKRKDNNVKEINNGNFKVRIVCMDDCKEENNHILIVKVTIEIEDCMDDYKRKVNNIKEINNENLNLNLCMVV